MLARIKPYIPAKLEPLLVGIWFSLRPVVRLIFAGGSRYCVVCGSHCRHFLSHGPRARRRADVMCPVCLSHDRHRSAWTFLSLRTDLGDGRPKRILHFAPEAELTRRFKAIPGLDYLSADLNSRYAMVRADITAMDFPEASFDALYCSHVLEHVPDDARALKEMFRVLRPGGWAMIQVPLSPTNAQTHEDPSITDGAERERLFWQHDHVRLYGLDIVSRITDAGFEVEAVRVGEFVPPHAIEEQALWSDERIFFCSKPPH